MVFIGVDAAALAGLQVEGGEPEVLTGIAGAKRLAFGSIITVRIISST